MAAAFPTYTAAEEAEIEQWLARAAKAEAAAAAELKELNTALATRTTVLGTKPSKADAALYKALAPRVRGWTAEERTGRDGLPHLVRYVDFVQSRPELFGLAAVADDSKVAIDVEEVLYVAPPVDLKAEKERLKKEKAAAAAAAAGGGGGAAPEGDKKKLADRTKKQLAPPAKETADAAAVATTPAAAPEAAAAAPQQQKKKEKKEKKDKPTRAPAAAPAAAPPSPGLIDLRVGHILKAIKHPEADSLYVSTIAMGDAAGAADTETYEGQVVRTVCSGLNGLVPLEAMQGRRVVVVCNLKPVKMRGIKSAAMVLAASPRLAAGEEDSHGGPVELVSPPADAPAGTRIFFEGWQGPDEKPQLNPKKKVWETVQPGFTTTDELEVAFDAGAVAVLGASGLGKLVAETGGVCTVASLKGATVR